MTTDSSETSTSLLDLLCRINQITDDRLLSFYKKFSFFWVLISLLLSEQKRTAVLKVTNT